MVVRSLLSLFLLFVNFYLQAQCWQSVSGGVNHSVAIKLDGTLWSWGFNGDGQLGNGTYTDALTPVKVGTASNWRTVAAGGNHTLAIKTDGTLWSWGKNQWGEIGNGTVGGNKWMPTKIGTATNWKSVSAGRTFSLAIKTDGSLWAWGDNLEGQLGFSTTALVPTRVGTASDWKSVSAGGNHTIAIKNDGSLWAWGSNLNGQLGDGTTTARSTPTRIGTDADWDIAFAGYNFSAAIKTDGTLWVWGDNYTGQLGLGSYAETHVPTRVGTDANWKHISTGFDNMVGVKTDGTVWAWGWIIGKFGFGPTDNSISSPTRVGTDSDWQSATSGERHAFAFKTDGTLWGWGDNAWGEVGNNELGNIRYPASVTMAPPIGDAVQSFCSTSTVANLKATGTGVQWYSLPTGGTPLPLSTTLLNGTHYYASQTISNCESVSRLNVTVSINTVTTPPPTGASSQPLCAGSSIANLAATGSSIKWYADASGGAPLSPTTLLQNGAHYFASQSVNFCESQERLDVTFTDKTTPAPNINSHYSICEGVPIGYILANVNWYETPSGGTKLSVNAPINDGTTYYASQRTGECGESVSRTAALMTVKTTPPPATVLGETWISIAAGQGTSMAVRSDGTLWEWGDEYVNVSNPTYRYVPRQTGPGDNWLSITTSGNRMAGIHSNGEIIWWSDNGIIVSPDKNWRTISTNGYGSDYHCSAIKVDGTLWTWGDNNSVGQLGDGTSVAKTNPTKIGSATDWKSVSNGSRFTLAIKTDGTLWAWGNNDWGQLGDGTTTMKNVPTRIGTDADWVQVSSGGSSSMAIKKDGSLWAWGDNSYGKLGDGTTQQKLSPVKIGTSEWQKVSHGGLHTLAIKKDGTLWGWGYNQSGALGTGKYSSSNSSVPKQIGSASNWKSVAAGDGHSLALTTEGKLWLWGSNDRGELGIDRIVSSIPDPFPLPAKQFTCGQQVTLAELPMQGTNIKWYTTDLTSVAPTTVLVSGVRFYATQTINGIESCKRVEIIGDAGVPLTPIGEQLQTFCSGALVEDLIPSGPGIAWFETESGSAPLQKTAALINGKQYYAANVFGGCESSNRLSVVAEVMAPAPPNGDAIQSFNFAAKVQDLVPSGSAIRWYETASGGSPLQGTEALVDGKHYYASEVFGKCESGARLGVLVELPTTDTQGPLLISHAPASGTSDVSPGTTLRLEFSENIILANGSIHIFDASTNSEIAVVALTSSNTLVTGSSAVFSSPQPLPSGSTVYVQVDNGTFKDLSENAFSGVTDTNWSFTTTFVCATNPPIGNSAQEFFIGATVADLIASGDQIKWYDLASGGSPLPTSTPLTAGTHYYASQTLDDCESQLRLDVTAQLKKMSQTITFESLLPKTLESPSFTLTAFASSQLPVSFRSSNTNVATISGTTVTIVGEGSTIITASQEGNSNFDRAPEVHHTQLVKKGQLIIFESLAPKNIGDLPFELNAIASSGLPVQFESSDLNVATISGNRLTILGVGSTTITASQIGDSNYSAAQSVSRTLEISAVTAIQDGVSELPDVIKFYPNPAHEKVVIKLPHEPGIKEIKMITPEGIEIFHQNTESSEVEINVKAFHNGIYLVVVNATRKVSFKLVIQH